MMLTGDPDTIVITDPMDSKFDLEKFINYKMSEQGSH